MTDKPEFSVWAARVKPLVWEPFDSYHLDLSEIAVANTGFHHLYHVQRDPWAHTFLVCLHPALPITDSTAWWESKGHIDLDAAKAAAQADHIARVAALLEPDPRVAKLVEAANHTVDHVGSEPGCMCNCCSSVDGLSAALAAFEAEK
jgi:hypothetical protein